MSDADIIGGQLRAHIVRIWRDEKKANGDFTRHNRYTRLDRMCASSTDHHNTNQTSHIHHRVHRSQSTSHNSKSDTN